MASLTVLLQDWQHVAIEGRLLSRRAFGRPRGWPWLTRRRSPQPEQCEGGQDYGRAGNCESRPAHTSLWHVHRSDNVEGSLLLVLVMVVVASHCLSRIQPDELRAIRIEVNDPEVRPFTWECSAGQHLAEKSGINVQACEVSRDTPARLDR